jgi:acyltransferase
MSSGRIGDGKRLDVIDFAKGVLILLVILGHITPWPKPLVPIRDWIYFFHMPLFFGISGWLLNTERQSSEKWTDFLHRAFTRLLLPWLVAGIFFTIFVLLKERTPIEEVAEAVWWMGVHPWYHLWFVPALFGMMVFTKLLLQWKLGVVAIFVVALVLATTWLLLNQDNIYGDDFLHKFGDKRVITMWPFFCAGIVARRFAGGAARPVFDVTAFATILVAIFFIAGRLEPGGVRDMIWLPINFSLIFLGARLLGRPYRVEFNRGLIWMGRNTLPIYLWHVLGVLLARLVVNPQKDVYLFWAVAIAGITAVLGAIRMAETIRSATWQWLFRSFLFGKN